MYAVFGQPRGISIHPRCMHRVANITCSFAGHPVGENEKDGNVDENLEFIGPTQNRIERASISFPRGLIGLSTHPYGCGHFQIAGTSNICEVCCRNQNAAMDESLINICLPINRLRVLPNHKSCVREQKVFWRGWLCHFHSCHVCSLDFAFHLTETGLSFLHTLQYESEPCSDVLKAKAAVID